MMPIDPEQHARQVDTWHQGRLTRLRAPDGWLSLVDRQLLEPGDNHLSIGTARLEGDTVHFRARPELSVMVAGQRITERTLHAADGAASERLDCDGRSYQLIRRGAVFAIRVKDPLAPALQSFNGIERYPVDPSSRVVARFEAHHPPRSIRLSFDLGEGPERTVPGVAHFQLRGQTLSLEPIVEEDSRRLFFVFGDQTNRIDTYPGGRFLYADIPAGDEVVLDFNLAFNPPCAFTEFATCPAIPPGNRLSVAVTAGERRP